ncbi:MAG: diacylglycerol kinase family protein [Desulfuromonadaceae bacterium]|nr:diacylglycerol kinase family protein [Desulfuromonadaceae bacterium]
MKSYLFVNPTSGHHSAQRLKFTMERLREHEITPDVLQVRTPADIYALCSSINSERKPCLVIVAGGDGTFNAVVNGLSPGTATLAILPFGTSNVLAKEIGITSLDDALSRIAKGTTRSLSVGVLELENRTLRFLLMAGIGFDGAVVRDVWPLAKRFLRQGAYALSALKNVFKWDPSLIKISTSKRNITCHTAIICNSSRYGGNFILSPESSPFSSGISAVCISDNIRSAYLRSALDLFRGRSETSQNLVREHSSAFEIHGRHPIQIDGDFVGYSPARISEYIDFAKMIV